MAFAFQLIGSYTTTPLFGLPSGIPDTTVPLNEAVQLTNQLAPQYVLSDSTPVSVDLGGLTGVNVLSVKVLGSKVRVRVTSTDGSQQALPVDTLLLWIDQAVPLTAIDLTLVSGGTETVVQLFLGQTS